MNKILKMTIFCAVALVLPICGFAQEAARTKLHRGIELYRKSDFRNAANAFRALTEEQITDEKGNAIFWLAKSLTALERYEEASNYLEHFMRNFSNSSYYP
ncbi:MAG: hypothetical protein LBT68_05940, partial [Spirochaetales bacterium]|nr:hypothetical protein [Spirochaetales bacterium]